MVDGIASAFCCGVQSVKTGGFKQHAIASWRVVVGLVADITAGEGIARGREAVGDEPAIGSQVFP